MRKRRVDCSDVAVNDDSLRIVPHRIPSLFLFLINLLKLFRHAAYNTAFSTRSSFQLPGRTYVAPRKLGWLLRLALNSLRTVSVSIVVVIVVNVAVVRTAAAAALSGHLAGVNVHEHALLGCRGNFNGLSWWQEGFQLANARRVDLLGEFDGKLNDESAFVVG